MFPGTVSGYASSNRNEGDSHPHRYRTGYAMRTRLKLLTVGLVLVTVTVAGCSSTAGSSGAVQDDASSAAASSSAASTGPAPSPEPVTPTAAPTEAPASPVASPTDSPALLGGSSNSNCATGLAYSCGDVGPGGGTVFYATSTPFTLSNGYTAACSNNCQYLEVLQAQLPEMPWCVGPGAKTSVSPGTGAAIGTRYSNTQTMATFSGYCSSGAAKDADTYSVTYSGNTYSDWFLPSQAELYQGYVQRAYLNPQTLTQLHGGSGLTSSYWSSSEAVSPYNPATQAIPVAANGGGDNYGKIYGFNVRPVRMFSPTS